MCTSHEWFRDEDGNGAKNVLIKGQEGYLTSRSMIYVFGQCRNLPWYSNLRFTKNLLGNFQFFCFSHSYTRIMSQMFWCSRRRSWRYLLWSTWQMNFLYFSLHKLSIQLNFSYLLRRVMCPFAVEAEPRFIFRSCCKNHFMIV